MWVTHAQNKNKSSTNMSLMQTSVKTPKNQRAQSSMTFKKDREKKNWMINRLQSSLGYTEYSSNRQVQQRTKQGSLTIQGMNKNNQQMSKHLN